MSDYTRESKRRLYTEMAEFARAGMSKSLKAKYAPKTPPAVEAAPVAAPVGLDEAAMLELEGLYPASMGVAGSDDGAED